MEEEEALVLRPLELSDESKGFLQLLEQLTIVGHISSQDFARTFGELFPAPHASSSSPYFIAVIEDRKRQKIVASGSIFVEKKFIHQCSSVGHIEDVVVDADMRGHHLGQRIVEFLLKHAKEARCYKVILDCNDENVRFYEKCGFFKKENHMAKYLD